MNYEPTVAGADPDWPAFVFRSGPARPCRSRPASPLLWMSGRPGHSVTEILKSPPEESVTSFLSVRGGGGRARPPGNSAHTDLLNVKTLHSSTGPALWCGGGRERSSVEVVFRHCSLFSPFSQPPRVSHLYCGHFQ